jgi:hypothetical protein
MLRTLPVIRSLQPSRHCSDRTMVTDTMPSEPTTITTHRSLVPFSGVALHPSDVPAEGHAPSNNRFLWRRYSQVPFRLTLSLGGIKLDDLHPPRRLHGGDSRICATSKGDGNTASLPRVANRPIESDGIAPKSICCCMLPPPCATSPAYCQQPALRLLPIVATAFQLFSFFYTRRLPRVAPWRRPTTSTSSVANTFAPLVGKGVLIWPLQPLRLPATCLLEYRIPTSLAH